MNAGMLHARLQRILPATSIVRREIRAQAPALFAVALLPPAFLAIETMSAIISSRPVSSYPYLIVHSLTDGWTLGWYWAVVASGVICGAHEEQRGALDFSLPLSRTRLFASKVMGSLGALLLWFVVSVGLIWLTIWCTTGETRMFFLPDPHAKSRPDPIFLANLPIMYCAALGVGAWTGRVVSGLVFTFLASVIGVVVLNLSSYGHLPYYPRDMQPTVRMLGIGFAIIAPLLGFLAAFLRYYTREVKR